MGLFERFFPLSRERAKNPQNSYTSSSGGLIINTPQELEEALRDGQLTASGKRVTAEQAMRVSAVFGCIRIITGAVATIPVHVKRRNNDGTRHDASDVSLWKLLRKKPNSWQTPAQFMRQMQAAKLLQGNAYALIVKSKFGKKEPTDIIPLDPQKVEVKQHPDLTLSYIYTASNGTRQKFKQDEIFHLFGLTLNGYSGVSVLTYARETIGESIAMADHGAALFKNGARASATLEHPGSLGPDGHANLRQSLDEFRSGGDREGKVLILEEAMKYKPISMTSVDAQWIESKKFTRGDVAMFFGVPPHMLGDTEKSTSWGSGIEQQSIGFVTYTLDDHLVDWEQTINKSLIPEDSDIYARFNRAALVKGDLKTRMEAYTRGIQFGIYNPDEVRALEDMNPRPGGDQFYPPPNMTKTLDAEGAKDEPKKTS